MAWIVVVPPSPRHPHERYQVCYQQGKRHRSAWIFPTRRRALAEQRAIERGSDELVKDHEVDLERARTLFGEYLATKWWPAWKDQHPTSEYGTRKKVEKRILSTFGNIPLSELDASTIGLEGRHAGRARTSARTVGVPSFARRDQRRTLSLRARRTPPGKCP